MNATVNGEESTVGEEIRQVDVAIVGSGFAGQCMAIKLKQSGRDDFVILERADDVGGTWRDNRYPGAACDVPSHLYSFSFEQNPDWSRKYPSQPELHAYLRRTADKYGLVPHIRFGRELLDARYDEACGRWQIETSAERYDARLLVLANGPLAEPAMPDIPGLADFQGELFHSARWNHDYDLKGKRVAVIGTGASAIQFVPEIAPTVARLDLYQRTPSWVIPRPDRKISHLEKFLLRRIKPLQWLYRWLIYWGHEARVMGIVLNPRLMKLFQKIGERQLRKQVPAPALREQLTPDYTIGCKRILLSNDWYPAVSRDNVELVTEGACEVRAHSVVDAAGCEREVDAIVLGTGFHATENPLAKRIRGREQSLSEAWKDGEEAYLGSLVSGFPNLFMVIGPNTGLGHSSMVFMIETHVNYIMRCLEQGGAGRPIEVKAEVQAGFNRRLQQRLAGSVWATGCRSWYQHKSGKITTLWPSFTFMFWWRLRKLRRTDFVALAAESDALSGEAVG